MAESQSCSSVSGSSSMVFCTESAVVIVVILNPNTPIPMKSKIVVLSIFFSLPKAIG